MPKLIKHPNTWCGERSTVILGHVHQSEYPYSFACPAPLCFFNCVAATEAKRDERRDNHQCPWFGGGHTTLSWSLMSDQYLEPIWKLLDEVVDSIKGPPIGSETLLEARCSARAYANTLALLMQPFFTTQQEISKEALRRWEARQRGEEPETPGIGRLKWKRPELAQGEVNTVIGVGEYDPKAPKRPTHTLNDEQVEKIKSALAAGMPAAMIAGAYGVTEKIVKQIQAG